MSLGLARDLPAGCGFRESRLQGSRTSSGITAAGGNFSQAIFAETGRRTRRRPRLCNGIPLGASVAKIAAGSYDGYLRSFAASVRHFRHPVIIGFGHEMNAYWYSWGYGQLPASTFVAAWRHIVTLFRSQGADNVTWLWTLQADEPGTGPIASWWPGAKYVTWVGIDGYYYRPYETFCQHLRQDHSSGTDVDQSSGPGIGGRGGSGC